MLDLLSAEEAVALVARATPANVFQEIQRLTALFARGGRLTPSFVYEPLPELAALRRSLERFRRDAAARGRVGALEGERAAELELEARLVEHIGAPSFVELAKQRFRPPSGELAARANAFVAEALRARDPGDDDADRFPSDDRASPASLFNQVRRLAAELALPVRIERRPGQLAVAATGRGLVAIRPGVMLTRRAASRVALHELLGHALPRLRAAHAALPLFRSGTAGSVEHEEGRALLVERRAGLLDAPRRRELALRHVAASAVVGGADFEETVRELLRRGALTPQALELAARAHRGGGLAREIVYLPALFEIEEAFARDPALERWFERGRVGIAAARELTAGGELAAARLGQPSNSMSTGV